MLLHARLEDVQPRVGAFDALFRRAPGGRCTMEVGAPTLDVLVARVLWLGVGFDVLDGPPALHHHLATLSQRLARAAKSA